MYERINKINIISYKYNHEQKWTNTYILLNIHSRRFCVLIKWKNQIPSIVKIYLLNFLSILWIRLAIRWKIISCYTNVNSDIALCCNACMDNNATFMIWIQDFSLENSTLIKVEHLTDYILHSFLYIFLFFTNFYSFYTLVDKLKILVHFKKYFEDSDPKWVNSILYIFGVNSLKLGSLYLQIP